MFGQQSFKWNVPNPNGNQPNINNSVSNSQGNNTNNFGMNNMNKTGVQNPSTFGNTSTNTQASPFQFQHQANQPFQPNKGLYNQQGNNLTQPFNQNGQQQPTNAQSYPQNQQKAFPLNNNQITEQNGIKPILSPSIQASQSGNQQKFPTNNNPPFGGQQANLQQPVTTVFGQQNNSPPFGGQQANPQQPATDFNAQQQQPQKQIPVFYNQQQPTQQQQTAQLNNNKPFQQLTQPHQWVTQPFQQPTLPSGQQQFNNQNYGQQQNLQQKQQKKKLGFQYCHFNHAYDGILDNKCSKKCFKLSCGHEVCLESMKAYLEVKFDMKGGNELFMSGNQGFQIFCPFKLDPPQSDDFYEFIYEWGNAPKTCNHILTNEDLQQFRIINILENFDFIPK